MLLLFFRHLELAIRLHAAVPWLPAREVYAHASAAYDATRAAERHRRAGAASPRVSAELLLAVAFVESRYDPTATSRMEGASRRTGHYPSLAPPHDLDVHASLYCGPLQTFAGSWHDCLALRDLDRAYAAGVSELETWLEDRRVRGNVVRALAGHGCGNFGVTTGHCNAYPQRVLWVRDRLAPPPPRLVEARRAPRA